MDYKEKYEQALSVARETYQSQPMYREWLEKMFPELKESEDEKVRKELIDAVQGLWDNDALPMPLSVKRKDEWIAWLEKQGKPSDENMKELLRTEYEKGRADAIAEMQGEWSEEDIIHLNNCISYMSRLDSSEMDWLKSLKGRVQPKQEWNEEDEKEYKYVLKFVDNILNNCGNKKDYEHCKRCYDWLKSLRPQNRWKPSERQLVCIQDAIEHFNLMGSPATTLNEILKQLKKLKEEQA